MRRVQRPVQWIADEVSGTSTTRTVGEGTFVERFPAQSRARIYQRYRCSGTAALPTARAEVSDVPTVVAPSRVANTVKSRTPELLSVAAQEMRSGTLIALTVPVASPTPGVLTVGARRSRLPSTMSSAAPSRITKSARPSPFTSPIATAGG